MTGLFLASWLLAPLVLLVACTGCGLLVLRASGARLPGFYVLPLGFATVIAVCAFLTQWDATAELSGPACGLLALAGFVVGWETLTGWAGRRREALWPALVGLGAFAAYGAPVLLSGKPGWSGYARIVDLAHQMDFAQWLGTHGRAVPATRDDSYLEVVRKTLDIGYPGGFQATLGSLSKVMGTDVAWLYQPLLAFAAGMGAIALYGLLRRAIATRPMRALAAVVAIQANVVYSYGLGAGFKELTSAGLLVLSAALLAEAPPGRARARALLPAAVALAATVAAFSLTIVPWLGVLLGGWFLVSLQPGPARARRVAVASWVVLGALVVVIAAPTGSEAISKLAPVAAAAEGANRTALVDTGNLQAAMPAKAAAGVWISNDHRFVTRGDTPLTNVLIVVVVALALAGVIAAARRRDWSLVLLPVACAIALLYFLDRTGPWIQLKAICVTAPVILACAFAGAAALSGWRPGRAGLLASWGLALVIAGGVLAGNAKAYHDITLAPVDRMRDLEKLGPQLAGKGPTLYPVHEEIAEYFLRAGRTTALTNPSQETFPRYTPQGAAKPGMFFARDIDDFALPYVESFRTLVLPRDPLGSRPPSNYRLVKVTPYVEVWERTAPAAAVDVHVAGGRRPDPAECRDLRYRAAHTSGAQLAVRPGPPVQALDLGGSYHSRTWTSPGGGQIFTPGPGRATMKFEVLHDGDYAVWLGGPVMRALHFTVDGKPVGEVADAWSYPQSWNRVAVVPLRKGIHTLDMERGGGSLAPGNGSGGQPIGPVILEQAVPGARERVARYPLSQAGAWCKRLPKLDWIEIVPGR